jgi:cytochrome c-type biogenesis protein
MAFGAGWSPCVGPILGGILFLAGQTGEIGRSILYLSAYSLGLGIPFLGAALFFDLFLKSLGKLKKHLSVIKKASGLLLILVGILIMFGRFQELNRFFLKTGNALADWDASGSAGARWIPVLVLLVSGALPLLKRGLAKKPVFSGITAIFFFLTCAVGLAHLTGILSLTGIAARWLLYQGI